MGRWAPAVCYQLMAGGVCGSWTVGCRGLQVRGVTGTGPCLPSAVRTERSTRPTPSLGFLTRQVGIIVSILSGSREDSGTWWAVAFFLGGKTPADKERRVSRQQIFRASGISRGPLTGANAENQRFVGPAVTRTDVLRETALGTLEF